MNNKVIFIYKVLLQFVLDPLTISDGLLILSIACRFFDNHHSVVRYPIKLGPF